MADRICLDVADATTRRLFRTAPAEVPALPTHPGRIAAGGLRGRGLYKRDDPRLPLISVITVVRNGVATLGQTFASVFSQDYENVEYIVVDGASDDGTRALIEQHGQRIDYWVSEPDSGIRDAMNKALPLATGSLIQLLNADDFLAPGALSAVAATYLRVGKPCVVYGDYTMLEVGLETEKPCRSSLDAHLGMSICHQAMFVHRDVYKGVGLFGEEHPIAFDYEWLLRALDAGVLFVSTGRDLVTYRDCGISSTALWRCTVDAERVHRRFYKHQPGKRAEFLARSAKHFLVASLKQQLYARLGTPTTNRIRLAYRGLKGLARRLRG